MVWFPEVPKERERGGGRKGGSTSGGRAPRGSVGSRAAAEPGGGG